MSAASTSETHGTVQTVSRSSPAVPLLPVLDCAAFRGARAEIPDVMGVGRPLLMTRGSAAIRAVLDHLQIGAGHEVLVPAFNCPSMVDPVRSVRADPVFYGITERLELTTAAIEPLISSRSRAVIAPHLFGKVQDLRALRDLCDAKGITLIEDCAHAFFGSISGQPVGSVGHFAIASPRKFFPIAEGGLLTSAGFDVAEIRVPRPPLHRAARLLFDSADAAVAHGRLGLVAPAIRGVKLARRAWVGASAEREASAEGSGNDAVIVEAVRADWSTRALLPMLITDRMVRKRREHFAQIVEQLRGNPGMEPLLDDLGQDAVPYMVPVILRNPERQFPQLKAQGVPMWRWEHSQPGVCPVTDHYARALIQIPCHQALRESEVEWMIERLLESGRSVS